MAQKIKTPEISDCWCGEKAEVIDWEYRDLWRVMCNKNHTLTKECGTRHRAICKWNNRVKERAEIPGFEGTIDALSKLSV